MECTHPRNLVSVHSKGLTGSLSPLESALTENIGGGPSALSEELLELSCPRSHILERIHAPALPHPVDSPALPSAPCRCGRMALRSCIPPPHPPRTHARPHPRSRRFLRGYGRIPPRFRCSRSRRGTSARLEGCAEKSQRQLGPSFSRCCGQPCRRHRPIGNSPSRRIQCRDDGRPRPRGQ